MSPSPVLVAIALGSNLGDRFGHVEWAVEGLRERLWDVRVSSFIETDPVGVPDAQPTYVNAVVTGSTDLSANVLLGLLMRLEHERGRTRPSLRAARTLDLDLILYGDRVIESPGLTVPHPAFRARRFVLEPLCEIAPDWIDPVSRKSVAELLAELKG